MTPISSRTQPPMNIRRLTAAVCAGAAAAALTAFLGNWPYAPSVGWDAVAVVFCTLTWLAVWPMSAEQTQDRATAEDPSRASRDILMLSACVASLGALSLVLIYAHEKVGSAKGILALLAVVSVAASWFCVHTIYTLRYAQLYYTEPIGGVDFNQQELPRYQDFAYLALTIGMTFQVSDTPLRGPEMRSTALRHALLSYLFGAVILGAAVNLVASLGFIR